ncbi:MAG: phosphoribosylanthranilate isomerase [Promethearchaeota archaeon]
MVFVKICGVRDEGTAMLAVENGADSVGFVIGVPSSPRHLEVTRALELVDKVKAFVTPTIVTKVNSIVSIRGLLRVFPECNIQPHSPMSTTYISELRELGKNLGRVVLAASVEDLSKVDLDSNEFRDVTRKVPYVLVDGSLGTGTGLDVDAVSGNVEELRPTKVVVAGGLTPDNVVDVIRGTRPFGVDVSTGVESAPGVKDPEKMVRFIQLARGVRM